MLKFAQPGSAFRLRLAGDRRGRLLVSGQTNAALTALANSSGKNLASFADIDRLREVVSEGDFAYYLRMYPELKEKL